MKESILTKNQKKIINVPVVDSKLYPDLNGLTLKIQIRYDDEKIPDLEAARSSAIWFDAELSDFTEEKLLARLPKLMEEFRKDIEELGLVY